MAIHDAREIPTAKRIVVKVGSSSISGDNSGQLEVLVSALAAAHKNGSEVVLVSSGAIATGMPLLNLDTKPDDLATSQALASVGQSRLITRYQTELEKSKIVAGQVLFTTADLQGKETKANAKAAMDRLLELRVLPIVNENDTVATQEIRFGDNDNLAAQVATLLNADVLILLSDIDALYDRPPKEAGAQRIEWVTYEDDLSGIQIGDTSTGFGTGGARTKVSAAKLANKNGIPVLLTDTSKVAAALSGERVGTWFEQAEG
jgi:glutamate 5-kinase